MINTLIRKDVRVLRPVLWGALGLGLLFYVIGPSIAFFDWRRDYVRKQTEAWALAHMAPPNISGRYLLEEAARTVLGGASFMWIVNLLFVTTVAGMAFAVERRERWGEFGGMLPVSRGRMIAAKALASAGVVAGILGVNAVVFVTAVTVGKRWNDFIGSSGRGNDLADVVWFYVTAGVGMSGVAWLLSSVVRSPVIATAAGMALALAVWCYLMFVISERGLRGEDQMDLQRLTAAVVFWIGLACFVAGTLVQAKRQSP